MAREIAPLTFETIKHIYNILLQLHKQRQQKGFDNPYFW
jgi:hypothetical protein